MVKWQVLYNSGEQAVIDMTSFVPEILSAACGKFEFLAQEKTLKFVSSNFANIILAIAKSVTCSAQSVGKNKL